MKHVSVYENFGSNPQSVIDFFDLYFTLVLHNRTIIKGLIQNEDKVKELFSDNQQYKLIDSCYPFRTEYWLDEEEVKRAECAEKNIKEYIGNRLEDLDCEIIYYRPMYIHRRLGYGPIKIFAPGANRDSGKEFSMEAKFYNKNDEEGIKKMPEIIAKAKEFASKYGVSHVLPHGPSGLRYPLKVLSKPEDDVETFDLTYGRKQSIFTPIEKFKWEDYYW
jgi:hypothetical protein